MHFKCTFKRMDTSAPTRSLARFAASAVLLADHGVRPLRRRAHDEKNIATRAPGAA
jgi:hypothetical protein